jgi:hypothetical protein
MLRHHTGRPRQPARQPAVIRYLSSRFFLQKKKEKRKKKLGLTILPPSDCLLQGHSK